MTKIVEEVEREADAVLRIADYLSRPQKFMPVAEARAEMKRTLEIAEKGSVVLTAHGEPQAAIVDFETFETMRGAVMQLLMAEMEASFQRTQARARAGSAGPETSFDELDSLVGEAVHAGRRERRGNAARGRKATR
ncbi:MAG TPA: type II toxin-antitoxin system prevent-host-death family antitoxin [Blastocatellia bacterium]|nr:type II toxin-antitoxin system prevent-host-death family antitoxin [Blastocatellia bacterium]